VAVLSDKVEERGGKIWLIRGKGKKRRDEETNGDFVGTFMCEDVEVRLLNGSAVNGVLKGINEHEFLIEQDGKPVVVFRHAVAYLHLCPLAKFLEIS